jgi:hypothetical protein
LRHPSTQATQDCRRARALGCAARRVAELAGASRTPKPSRLLPALARGGLRRPGTGVVRSGVLGCCRTAWPVGTTAHPLRTGGTGMAPRLLPPKSLQERRCWPVRTGAMEAAACGLRRTLLLETVWKVRTGATLCPARRRKRLRRAPSGRFTLPKTLYLEGSTTTFQTVSRRGVLGTSLLRSSRKFLSSNLVLWGTYCSGAHTSSPGRSMFG